MSEQKRVIIMVHESILQSLVKDVFTFGFILAVLYLNYKLLNNNGVTAFVFILFLVLSAMMRANSYINKGKRIRTKEEADELVGKYIQD